MPCLSSLFRAQVDALVDDLLQVRQNAYSFNNEFAEVCLYSVLPH